MAVILGVTTVLTVIPDAGMEAWAAQTEDVAQNEDAASDDDPVIIETARKKVEQGIPPLFHFLRFHSSNFATAA